jgi:hypothetical protein
VASGSELETQKYLCFTNTKFQNMNLPLHFVIHNHATIRRHVKHAVEKRRLTL